MAPGTVDNEAPSTEKSCEKPAFADKMDKEIEQKTIKTDGSDSGKFLGLLPIFFLLVLLHNPFWDNLNAAQQLC